MVLVHTWLAVIAVTIIIGRLFNRNACNESDDQHDHVKRKSDNISYKEKDCLEEPNETVQVQVFDNEDYNNKDCLVEPNENVQFFDNEEYNSQDCLGEPNETVQVQVFDNEDYNNQSGLQSSELISAEQVSMTSNSKESNLNPDDDLITSSADDLLNELFAAETDHVSEGTVLNSRESKVKGTKRKNCADDNGIIKLPRLEVGSSINSMRNVSLVKVLGEGGFGQVGLYRSKTQNAHFAIKEIKDYDAETDKIERKVLRLGGSSWTHFLTSLCGEFIHEGHQFFVMNFMSGGDLDTLLRLNKAPFSSARARLYIAEIICGLEFLHINGIVHRDLKLDNILVDEDGHIKISDFGLSVEVWHGKTIMEQGITGTPSYVAPEVILERAYDSCCDWWSLGVMLYYMLTFKMPFVYHGSLSKLYRAIVNKNVKYPKHISATEKALLEQLLERNPFLRIGYKGGFCPWIRQHDFFDELNWNRVEQRQIEPLWKPAVTILKNKPKSPTTKDVYDRSSLTLLCPEPFGYNGPFVAWVKDGVAFQNSSWDMGLNLSIAKQNDTKWIIDCVASHKHGADYNIFILNLHSK
ncbi:hypothetical protein OS493_019544 [Desmophyllum pertusum]|uniref:Protein kinase domain-containing protein n=1 Tax=Desmophyllum pertusum TaxID=174260 RepID=A0A9X0D353_9CNID|nr:hypothetical protein OS493_019544 [Desmophyllum pertusum]